MWYNTTTTVTLTGTGCGGAGATSCIVATFAAVTIYICNLGAITVTPGTSGLCNVAINSHGGTSTTTATFSYANVPTITSVAITGCATTSTTVKFDCPISSSSILTIIGTDIFTVGITGSTAAFATLTPLATCGTCTVTAITGCCCWFIWYVKVVH